MALSIRISGDEDFRDFYRRTRLFRRRLRNRLHDEFADAGEDLANAARRNALTSLFPAAVPARYPQRPRSTGLRTGLSRSVKVRVRRGGDGVEARVVATHPLAPATDGRQRGAGGRTWRHPVWGNRDDPWVAQIPSHWFSRAAARGGQAARAAGAAAARDALDNLGGRGR